MGFSPARVLLAAPLARAFSAPAYARFHESRCRDRKRTRQAETNPTAGVRELRTEHPRRKQATKIRIETAKVRDVSESRGNVRAGTSKIIALLLPCFFARSGRKFVETRRREFPKRLQGAAMSFLITMAPGNADLAQNPVRKGRSVQGAQQRNFARDDYRHMTRPSTCTVFPKRTAAGGLEDDPSPAVPLLAA